MEQRNIYKENLEKITDYLKAIFELTDELKNLNPLERATIDETTAEIDKILAELDKNRKE